MKKLLTLLTLLLCVVVGAKAAEVTIFDLSTATSDDYTLGGSTTTGDVKINSNTNPVSGIKFANSWSGGTNYFKLAPDGGFKVGDVITIAGAYNNSAEKETKIALYDSSTATTAIFTTEQLVNGRTSEDNPKDETYTLTADASELYFARDGNTATFITKLVITRTVLGPEITSQPVSASYKQNAVASALTVAATASAGTLTYQWYSNTTESTAGATELTGETGASYTPSTATLGTTYYFCAVTDDNGTINSSIACVVVANTALVGYTEAISGTKLLARSLISEDEHVSISGPVFGSNITDYSGTSKDVIMDGNTYKSTDSWRKSQNGEYTGQNVGYTLTIASGYMMNVSHVSAKIAVADDTYTWYVEIVNGTGTQVWKSGEKTSKKTDTSGVVDADVTDKADIQGLTGNVTVNLWVKQGGSTKYFCINYLQLTIETEEDTRATYAMSVSQNILAAGTVTPEDGAEVTEGESVAFTATPVDAYKFVKWTIDGVDHTENPYVLNDVTATHTAVATFALRYVVSYDLGENAGTTNKVLNNVNRSNGFDEKYSADDDSYTIPAYAHKYLYKEGYVFDKWVDGDGNEYASGAKIAALTKDITLSPTFKATTQTLEKATSETVVTWTFAKADILFADWQSNSQYGYYTKEVNVNGETIAVPMSITEGKVGNWGRTDAIAQTNQNTKFTIPAIKGMVVEIKDAYIELSTTTVAGSTDYTGTGTKSISYTYTGSDETIDIVIGEKNQYLKTIEVTYPAATSVDVTVAASGLSTLAYAQPLDFSAVDGLKAYVVNEVTKDAVSLKEVTEIPANTGVILEGTASTKYSVPVAASAEAPAVNKLAAAVAATAVEANAAYILKDGLFHLVTTASTVPAGKAYLPATEVPAGARSLRIVAADETTGIEALESAENAEMSVYNLQGQRVQRLQKGLNIVNGKKVIVK